MKIVQLFIAFLICFSAQSQTNYSNVNTPIKWSRGGFDSLFIPVHDTITPWDKSKGWIVIKDSSIYQWKTTKWKAIKDPSLIDSLSHYSSLWGNQTITGQKNFTKPVVLGNGIASNFGASLQIFHRENLSNVDITKSQVGVTFIQNNVSTIPYLNKYSVILVDTLNITSDTAKWRGFTVSLSNSGSKLGFVTGYYYTSSGNWAGAEVAYGNKRGRNTFNDSIGRTGIGLIHDQINAKLHIRNTRNSGDAFLLEDSTGATTLMEVDSINHIGIGGKSSSAVAVKVAGTMAIDNVGIGTNTPAATAIIDATSTTKGVLFPRMTTSQKNAITLDASNDGLMVYDITLHKLFINENGVWAQK